MNFKEKFANGFLNRKKKELGALNAPDKEKKDSRTIAYEKARQEFLSQTINQAKVLNTWKMAFFMTFLLMMVSICYSFYLAQRSTLIPYVIE
ncbi:MAG: hypothetical protein ACLT40_05795, partial [Fusobacterium sp.]